MKRYLYCILLCHFILQGFLFAQSKGLALVIGNNNYQNIPLKNPTHDAIIFAQSIKELGFELLGDQAHLNLNRNDFIDKIIHFGDELKKHKVAIFYYAGHAVQAGESNYFLPIDEKISNNFREEYVYRDGIDMKSILAQMEKASIEILILDACRNSITSNSRSIFGNTRGLRSIATSNETMIFYSTKPGELATDGGDQPNSPFTTALVENIKKKGLKLEDVTKQTIRKTKELTNGIQSPWYEGSISLDFYFTTPSIVENKVNINWIFIKGGSFVMGSKHGGEDEEPVHDVKVRDFEMSETEVTVAQYRKCVDAGVCSKPSCNWNDQIDHNENHPVSCVDWFQSRTFAKWVGADLPSEAQWEYASRSAGKDIKYPWGNHEPTCGLANYNECGRKTIEVCKNIEGKTSQGLCEMIGNVREWVLDEYHNSYHNAPKNDIAWCSDRDCNASTSVNRVSRGGSWSYGISGLRSTNRSHNSPNYHDSHVGFRIVKFY